MDNKIHTNDQLAFDIASALNEKYKSMTLFERLFKKELVDVVGYPSNTPNKFTIRY